VGLSCLWLAWNTLVGPEDYCCGVLEVGLGVVLVPEVGLPEVGVPTGVDVLLAGWPIPAPLPALPPLMVCMSEIGS
jgi:hypothetical protein